MTEHDAIDGRRPFRFGVVAPIQTDLPSWRDQVRRIADRGYSTLLMPDVQQWQPSPGPTLAIAATIADDLRVGTWVYASPLRAPSSMAWEAHSLTVLTAGTFRDGHRPPGDPGWKRNYGSRVCPCRPQASDWCRCAMPSRLSVTSTDRAFEHRWSWPRAGQNPGLWPSTSPIRSSRRCRAAREPKPHGWRPRFVLFATWNSRSTCRWSATSSLRSWPGRARTLPRYVQRTRSWSCPATRRPRSRNY